MQEVALPSPGLSLWVPGLNPGWRRCPQVLVVVQTRGCLLMPSMGSGVL